MPHHPGRISDSRGIALPLALIALIAVTVIATSAIVTSTSELALSGVHRDAVGSLYMADAASDSLIAVAFQQASAEGAGPTLLPGTSTSADGKFRLRVSELSKQDVITTDIDGEGRVVITGSRTEVLSVLAEPSGTHRGRSVGKLMSAVRESETYGFLFQEATAFGGMKLTLVGSSKIIAAQDPRFCDIDADDISAITHLKGADLTDKGKESIVGEERELDITADSLVSRSLGGKTIPEFAKDAEILIMGSDLNNQNKPSSLDSKDAARAVTHPMNWGCPGKQEDKRNCYLVADTSRYAFVAIDAQGGEVNLTGEHAQGILVVYNGHLSIQGNFTFRGVLIVEGNLDVRGTGGDTKIQGAVLVKGTATFEEQKKPDDESHFAGNAIIQYNACAVLGSQLALGQKRLETASQAFTTARSKSWFELIR
jgi:hypothetical protein